MSDYITKELTFRVVKSKTLGKNYEKKDVWELVCMFNNIHQVMKRWESKPSQDIIDLEIGTIEGAIEFAVTYLAVPPDISIKTAFFE